MIVTASYRYSYSTIYLTVPDIHIDHDIYIISPPFIQIFKFYIPSQFMIIKRFKDVGECEGANLHIDRSFGLVVGIFTHRLWARKRCNCCVLCVRPLHWAKILNVREVKNVCNHARLCMVHWDLWCSVWGGVMVVGDPGYPWAHFWRVVSTLLFYNGECEGANLHTDIDRGSFDLVGRNQQKKEEI